MEIVMYDASLEEDAKKDEETFYSSEAFCSSQGNLISMNDVAPKILAAESEDVLIRICHEHKLHYKCFFRRAKREYVNTPDGTWRLPFELLPSDMSFLFEHIKTFNAYLQLYAVCHTIAHGKSVKTTVADLFDLMYHAREVRRQLVAEVHHAYDWIPRPDVRNKEIEDWLRVLPQFPLTSFFIAFQNTEGKDLQSKYGGDYNESSRQQRHKIFYWDNSEAAEDIMLQLQSFAHAYPVDDAIYIFSRNTQGLATKYLELIDKYIEKDLRSIKINVDSLHGTAKLVTYGSLESALSLWLLTQIQGKVEYRICHICGKYFILGSQKKKIFCASHEKSERDYYNRKLQRLRKETIIKLEAERQEHTPFEFVWKRDDPDASYESESDEGARMLPKQIRESC